jgi:hypothetical protein
MNYLIGFLDKVYKPKKEEECLFKDMKSLLEMMDTTRIICAWG